MIWECDFVISPSCQHEVSTSGDAPFKKISVRIEPSLINPRGVVSFYCCDPCLIATGVAKLMALV